MKEHNFEYATNMWVAESFVQQVIAQISLIVCHHHKRIKLGFFQSDRPTKMLGSDVISCAVRQHWDVMSFRAVKKSTR